MKTAQEFWANVDVADDKSCWEWKRSRDTGGHGQVVYKGRHARAHRIAWELARGAIPNGLFVCHHCDDPPCCNPSHLFLGTNKDNMSDMVAKGRGKGKGPAHLTPEWRAKISASLRGKPGVNRGRHWSDEYKAKMSKALTGKRNPRYGKPHTEESKAKMSAARKATWQKQKAFTDGDVKDEDDERRGT